MSQHSQQDVGPATTVEPVKERHLYYFAH